MGDLNLIQALAVWALPLIFAVTLHEVAHGYVARALGDDTASRLGRLSLNPIRHVDPFGTLILPGLMLVGSTLLGTGGLIFGWAKPVPVNVMRLGNPRRDMALVAAAGPMSNLLMALFWALMLRVAVSSGVEAAWVHGFVYMCLAGVLINLLLMVLNLLPVPPLDGGRIAVALLPRKLAMKLAPIEPYGMVIVIVLFATGILGALIGPPITGLRAFIFGLLGLT